MYSKIVFALLLVPAVLACKRRPPNYQAKQECVNLLPFQANSALRWQAASDGHVPENAISAGDPQGCFVGRVGHEGALVPGKVCPRNKGMYIAWDKKEFFYRNYEVLVNLNGEDLEWVGASGGHVPVGGVPNHNTCDRFVCRNHYKAEEGGWKGQTIHIPGYMHINTHHCHTPYFLKDRNSENYEILVNKVPGKYYVSNVTYQTDQGKIIEMEPASLATTYVENRSRREQTIWKTVSYKKSETRTWQHTFGVRIGVDFEFSGGIPFVFQTGIKISPETSYQGKWARATTVERGFETTVELTVPGMHRQRVSVLARQGTLDVPYTAKLVAEFRDGTKKSKSIAGWFKNVNHHDVRVEYGNPEHIPEAALIEN